MAASWFSFWAGWLSVEMEWICGVFDGSCICVCVKIRADLLSTRVIGSTGSGLGGKGLASRIAGRGLYQRRFGLHGLGISWL